MKEEETLPKLLNELADATAAEPARDSLAEDIKQQIPHRLAPHKKGMDTVNIMIDLRISKLAAAAVIIITMILSANFLGGRNSAGDGIYRDGKLLIKYCLTGEDATKSDVLSGVSNFYEYLLQQGRDVVYYGGGIDTKDNNAVLMHWKLPDDKYRVMFADLRTEEVTAEELVKLQARMLQKKAK
jgi:hypothetical protein